MRYYKSDAVYRDVVMRFYGFGFVASTATSAGAGLAIVLMGWNRDYLAFLPIVHVIAWQVISNGMIRQFRDLRDYVQSYEKEPLPHPTEQTHEEHVPMKIKGRETEGIEVSRKG